MNRSASKNEVTPSEQIDRRIGELADWRGEMLARVRKIIRSASPDLVEEWKWDTPVWSDKGNVVAAGAFQDHIKLNFFKGAQLEDPQRLFNAGLDAKATRAIDIFKGDTIDEAALTDLIRAAVALNSGTLKSSKSSAKTTSKKPSKK